MPSFRRGSNSGLCRFAGTGMAGEALEANFALVKIILSSAIAEKRKKYGSGDGINYVDDCNILLL